MLQHVCVFFFLFLGAKFRNFVKKKFRKWKKPINFLWFLGISFAIFRNSVATSLCTQAFSFLHPKISTPLHECPTTNSWFTSVPISRHSILHAKALVISSQHSILQAKALVSFSWHSILQAKSIGEFLLAFHSSSKKHWWVSPGIPFFKHFPQTNFPFFLFDDVNMACWFFTKSVVHVKMACWFFIKSVVHAGSCHTHTHTHTLQFFMQLQQAIVFSAKMQQH